MMSEKIYQPDFHGAGFHWREGLCFKRLDNGDVQFSIREHQTAERAGLDYYGDAGDHNPTWIIPAAEWVSIVAAVGAAGSTRESYAHVSQGHIADAKHLSSQAGKD